MIIPVGNRDKVPFASTQLLEPVCRKVELVSNWHNSNILGNCGDGLSDSLSILRLHRNKGGGEVVPYRFLRRDRW